MHGVNPESGELLWKTRAGEGGVLGGIEWGFATDGSVAYISLSSALEKKAGEAGGLVAMNVLDGKTRWSVPPHADTCAGGRAAIPVSLPRSASIPGVVFSGSLDGHLRAYDAEAGRVLWDVGHRARVRHGQQRAGARRFDQRTGCHRCRGHALCELGLRLARVHARECVARVFG